MVLKLALTFSEISKGKKIQDFWKEISNKKLFILQATDVAVQNPLFTSCSLSRGAVSPQERDILLGLEMPT